MMPDRRRSSRSSRDRHAPNRSASWASRACESPSPSAGASPRRSCGRPSRRTWPRHPQFPPNVWRNQDQAAICADPLDREALAQRLSRNQQRSLASPWPGRSRSRYRIDAFRARAWSTITDHLKSAQRLLKGSQRRERPIAVASPTDFIAVLKQRRRPRELLEGGARDPRPHDRWSARSSPASRRR